MSDVIKVTSKGQVTLPASIRKIFNLDKDSYIAVDTIGDYIIMKKVGLKLKEISDLIRKNAKEQNITENDLRRALAESREEVWEGA